MNFIALILGITIIATSCKGQSNAGTAYASFMNRGSVKGDSVKELGSNIMVVYQDKHNIYWFGSWETGVYRYDGKTLINYNKKHGLAFDRIDEIKEDASGNIYFNCCHPVSTITKFDGRSFTKISATPDNKWALEANDLWFKHAYKNGQVYRYDGKILHELTFPRHPQFANPFEIYSIYKDKKGNVWFGSNPVGVCRYNGKAFDWITENDVTELHNGPANGVRSITEDGDGYFWFNTEYRYHVADRVASNGKSFYERQKSIGSLNGNGENAVNEFISIARDNNNSLWIATYRDGVWKYDGKKTIHYAIKRGTAIVTIFSIFKDNNGALWLGTHENGAYKFNGRAFEQFKP